MAIPFKSPIRIGSICASDGDATKLTLNVYDMKLQSSDSSIQINDASGNNFINLTSSNINIKGSNIVIDGSKLTVPTNTRLKSIAEDRVFTSQGLACIQDINNAIISKVQFSHIWKRNQSVIFVMPGSNGQTQLINDGTPIYTFENDVSAILGIRSSIPDSTGTLIMLIKIKNDSFDFETIGMNLASTLVWKNTNNSNFTYISNYSLL